MARKFQIKRGLKADLPALALGELALTTDEEALYVGAPSGNVPVGTQESDVFVAEYGVTTNAEIEAARTAGKTVFCVRNVGTSSAFYAPLISMSGSGTNHRFLASGVYSDDIGANIMGVAMQCVNDEWSVETKPMPYKHAATHAADGEDPITPESIGAKAADESDVFIATFDETTQAEVKAAYDAGKAIFATNYNGDIWPLVKYQQASGAFIFSGNRATAYVVWLLNSSGWTESASGNLVAKTGDTMTGVLNISNPNDYIGMQKYRSINDVLYNFAFGVGSDTARGASGSLRLTDDAGTVLGRIDAWENGELTYNAAGLDYLPICRIATGSYTGSGNTGSSTGKGNNELTFDFAPKYLVVLKKGAFVAASNVGFTITGHPTSASVSSSATVTMSWSNDNKTVSWYGSSAAVQLNTSKSVYQYFALG